MQQLVNAWCQGWDWEGSDTSTSPIFGSNVTSGQAIPCHQAQQYLQQCRHDDKTSCSRRRRNMLASTWLRICTGESGPGAETRWGRRCRELKTKEKENKERCDCAALVHAYRCCVMYIPVYLHTVCLPCYACRTLCALCPWGRVN